MFFNIADQPWQPCAHIVIVGTIRPPAHSTVHATRDQFPAIVEARNGRHTPEVGIGEGVHQLPAGWGEGSDLSIVPSTYDQ